MALAPQLPPTDFAELEKVESREDRDKLYAEQQIYKHDRPQGMRYTKGTDTSQQPRSWQSLDVVLRSDANSAAALPTRQLRRSRLFTALTVAAGILTVAGAAASAREGLNLGDLDAAGGVLLGAGLATVGFAITSGVFYGKSRRGYERAVDIYNDSLGMRLGILDGRGQYIPPRGSVVDADGNVVLDPRGDAAAGGPAAAVEPARGPTEGPAEAVTESPTAADAEPVPTTASEPVEEAAASSGAEATEATDAAGSEEGGAPPSAEPDPTPPAEPESVAVPAPGPATAKLRLRPRI